MLVFKGPPTSGPSFDYLNTVIGAGQSIMHPFGIAFVTPPSPAPALPTSSYVSNQDSNVVALVSLTAGQSGQVNGSLGSGAQSSYLVGLGFPATSFLNGTFVASQYGNLKGVAVVAPPVPKSNGGLGLAPPPAPPPTPIAPSNSVRDVAVASGILFVCDEVDCQINMSDRNSGNYLGSGSLNSNGPTHLAVNQRGLWVSAGKTLYWSVLPASQNNPALSFQQIQLNLPANNKIGGISFDKSGSVYVIFQDGTHTKGTGTIQKCTVTAGSSPSLSSVTTFATIADDTPEFCLWVSDSHWPT